MKIICFAFLLLFNRFAFASLSENSVSLTWQKCLEILKEKNSDYQAALMTFQATEALETSAASGFYPSLSASLGYTQSSTTSNDIKSNDTSYSANLTATQSVFAGLKDFYKLNQAQSNTRLAKANFQISTAKISYDFIQYYQSLLSAQESLKLAENIAKRRQENLRLVELKFESGRENKGSELLSEAYLAQSKYEVLQAKNNLRLAQINLAQMLGFTNETELKIIEPVPVSHLIESPDFKKLAIETPDYQQIVSSYDSSLAAFQVARSAFFPTLGITGSIGKLGNDFYPKNDKWSIGATLNIPLFDGGKDFSATQSASYTKEASQIQKNAFDQKESNVLQTAYQKYVESIEKMKVDESFQKAVLMRSEIARTQYNNGLVSFTDWDNIENDLILRQKAYLQSKKDRILNEAAWNQARGVGVLK